MTIVVAPEPMGRKPQKFTASRAVVYALLIFTALLFLSPLYMMVLTSLKTMEEIRTGSIFALPLAPTFDAWVKAWFSACTGLTCNGLRVGFWNSVTILVPSVIVSNSPFPPAWRITEPINAFSQALPKPP